MQAILDYRIDVWVFALLCILMLGFTQWRLRVRPMASRLDFGSWIALLTLVVLGACLAELSGHFERDRLTHMVEGLAPTYAFEFEEAGHARLPNSVKADDPLYLELIERQKSWLEVNPTVADIYTFRKLDDGTIILLVDSETDYDHNGLIEGETEQRTEPGEVYPEITTGLLSAFDGRSVFEANPYTDRWGTWVSAMVPLRNERGEVEAVLGIDYGAKQWLSAILIMRASALVLVGALVIILTAFSTAVGWQRMELKERAVRESLLRMKTDELTRYTTALENTNQQLEEARRELEQAAKAKSQFLANMSHEIRTPLNGVIGMLELLSDTQLDTVQQRFAHTARISADCLLSLINDILDFSKIEAGKLELDEADFDLKLLLEDVGEMFAARAEKKGLELCLDVQAEVPSAVRGDPDRLRQIIINLVTNAIKFTDRGQIVIAARIHEASPHEYHLAFSVKDSGIGIPADRMNRLFHSFSQVDASTTRKYGGTGLGLALSKQLTELFGGNIYVESEAGKGSTFGFTVKLKHAVHPISERVLPTSLRNLRVLVVDDNATNREILRATVLSWGFECQLADDAPTALNLLRESLEQQRLYDLAIVDMQMPDMDGLELVERIRQDEEYKKLKLIMLTSLSNLMTREELAKLGLSSYLTKPVRQSRLFDAVIECTASESSEESNRIKQAAKDEGAAEPLKISAYVLLAEDNDINQFVAMEILRRSGLSGDVVSNGKEALDAARTGRYDIILMDCQMPVMDGFEATRNIRAEEAADPSRRRMPIIALTANAVKGDREACLQAGMDDYVTKPINPADLMRAIRDAMTTSKSEESVVADASVAPTATPSVVPGKSTQAGRAGAKASKESAVVDPSTNSPSSHDVVTMASSNPRSAEGTNGAPKAMASIEEVFQVEVLLKNCMDDPSIGVQILEMFPGSVESQFELLEDALTMCRQADVVRATHTIKGLAGNVAAIPLRTLAAQLEQAGKNNELLQVMTSVTDLRNEVDRCLSVIPELKERLARQAAEQT